MTLIIKIDLTRNLQWEFVVLTYSVLQLRELYFIVLMQSSKSGTRTVEMICLYLWLVGLYSSHSLKAKLIYAKTELSDLA